MRGEIAHETDTVCHTDDHHHSGVGHWRGKDEWQPLLKTVTVKRERQATKPLTPSLKYGAECWVAAPLKTEADLGEENP